MRGNQRLILSLPSKYLFIPFIQNKQSFVSPARGVICTLVRRVIYTLVRGVICTLLRGVTCTLVGGVICTLVRDVIYTLVRGVIYTLVKVYFVISHPFEYKKFKSADIQEIANNIYCCCLNIFTNVPLYPMGTQHSSIMRIWVSCQRGWCNFLLASFLSAPLLFVLECLCMPFKLIDN